MSVVNPGKFRQFRQIYDQPHSLKGKHDLSLPTYKKIRYDFVLDHLGEKLLSSGSKWIEINHIGTQTVPQDPVRPAGYKSRSMDLKKERMMVRRGEVAERKGGAQEKKGSASKKMMKKEGKANRTERKRRTRGKKVKERESRTGNRVTTASSRTTRYPSLGPTASTSAKRVRNNKKRPSKQRSASRKDDGDRRRRQRARRPKSSSGPGAGGAISGGDCCRDGRRSGSNHRGGSRRRRRSTDDSSSRKRSSIKTLFRASLLPNACQSETTTFVDASAMSEIAVGQSSLVDAASSSSSRCVGGDEERAAGLTKTTSLLVLPEVVKVKAVTMTMMNREDAAPNSPSGAGDSLDAQRQCDSPYQSSFDGCTDLVSDTTNSSRRSQASREDELSPKSSLLSFSGEVLRIRYSNPRLVLHALNPSGDRPKWPFNDQSKVMKVSCKGNDDMVFLFDSQHCDDALACWEETYKAKYRRMQRREVANAVGATPSQTAASPSRRNAAATSRATSKRCIHHRSKSQLRRSLADAPPASSSVQEAAPHSPPSARHSFAYCCFRDYLQGLASHKATSTAKEDTSLSRDALLPNAACDALCVGHNTCLDLTDGLLPPTAAGDSTRGPRRRSVGGGGEGLTLHGEPVWRTKATTTTRSSGGREDVEDRRKVRSGGGVARTSSNRAEQPPTSTARTSRGATSSAVRETSLWTPASCAAAQSGMWEIGGGGGGGGETAQFACDTIVISPSDKDEDPFQSKTEPLLLGHFRSGIRKRNVSKGQKGACSAGPSIVECEQPSLVEVDTTLATSSVGVTE